MYIQHILGIQFKAAAWFRSDTASKHCKLLPVWEVQQGRAGWPTGPFVPAEHYHGTKLHHIFINYRLPLTVVVGIRVTTRGGDFLRCPSSIPHLCDYTSAVHVRVESSLFIFQVNTYIVQSSCACTTCTDALNLRNPPCRFSVVDCTLPSLTRSSRAASMQQS